jgi:hypothetical protein
MCFLLPTWTMYKNLVILFPFLDIISKKIIEFVI